MKESVRSLEAKKMETLQVWSACLRLGSLVFRTCGSTTSCLCVASLIMQNSISLVLLLGSEFTQLTHTSGCEVCPQAFSTWDLSSAWKPSWVASIQFPALASLCQLFSHRSHLFGNMQFIFGDYSSMRLCVFCPPKIFRVVLEKSRMARAMLPLENDNACMLEKPQWCVLCCSSPEICCVCFS